jgi:hypothetical protein
MAIWSSAMAVFGYHVSFNRAIAGEYTMKTLLLVLGVLAMAMGLLWAAQGAGYFPYPASSFMINDVRWVYYGLATAAGGVALVVLARRR